MQQNPQPRIADRHPETLTAHGEERIDNYYWLRDKTDPNAIAYLKQENSYTDAVMQDTKQLQTRLFEEMKSRIRETDTSAPVKIDDFYYYVRTEAGKEYPIFCRKRYSLEADEEILLDQNELATDVPNCAIGAFKVSPDHTLLAYSMDPDGSEEYTLYIKSLDSGAYTDAEIPHVGSIEWCNDGTAFVYTIQDSLWRPYKVFRHELGVDPADDTELFHETDERFFVGVYKSLSKQYLFIDSTSQETTEVRFLDANSHHPNIRTLHPREQEHRYTVEHHQNTFYIATNKHAENFKLVQAPVDDPGMHNWEDVVPHQEHVLIRSFIVFWDYLCVHEVTEGVPRFRIRNLGDGEDHYIDFREDAYDAWIGANPDFEADTLRVEYTSFTAPCSVIDYGMAGGTKHLVKREDVLGGYDPDDYITERVYARAEDGAHIPVSLVYRKDLAFDQPPACWLEGYGAYGISLFPGFGYDRVNLLERGFVCGIAHIRGGREKGEQWYQNGKYLHKQNTITDFIAAAEHLIDRGYTASDKLAFHSGSAGGILLGGVMNMRPDICRTVVAEVPFVDVLTTMLDESLPLTVAEYEEWGNPQQKDYYDCIRSYSPYDNVSKQDYPNLLVTAGLNDPRVSYWEPAKWIAGLRAHKTDDNLILLKTEMDEGHAGASGRYKYLQETALMQAFTLKTLGLDKS